MALWTYLFREEGTERGRKVKTLQNRHESGADRKTVIVMLVLAAVFLLLSFVLPSPAHEEGISEAMKDAVLHEEHQVSIPFAGLVNPALTSAFTVTVVLLLAALVIRIVLIPRFAYVPGTVQLLLEELVGFFSGLACSNSPHRNRFLSVYVFTAGAYIFTGTLFELFGFQVLAADGTSVAMPAPLSDINAAIAMGCLSYLVILSGGIAGNRLKGVINTLKDFSLPISMSFRLFGALLSGLLVTDLVYHYAHLSYVLPVVVAVLFTLLHAIIQTYVLTMLTALFYGEVSEPGHHRAGKKNKAALPAA